VTWFRNSIEPQSPIAKKIKPTEIKDIYDPIILPQSKVELGSINAERATKLMKVKIIAIPSTSDKPISFPPKILDGFNGLVNNSSKVPEESSSEKLRILKAGIKKRKSQGESSKKGLKSPKPIFSKLNGVSKNQSIKVLIVEKPIRTK